jgi:Tfp pilus assembly protein PilV
MKFLNRPIINKNLASRGFTLVETLIYMFLFVVLILGIINSTVLLAKNYRNIKSVRSIENSAISAMDRMTREIRDASSISSGTYNVNPGILILNGTDSSGTAETLKFYVSNGRVLLDRNGINIGQLTQADANVSSLVFRSISTTTSSAVKIEMTIDNGSSTPYITKNFYGTAILRSSY